MCTHDQGGIDSLKRTIQHYSDQAQHYYSLYHSVSAESVHGDWYALLKATSPGMALDIGAGSGRDANWLASNGWHVVAAEPADKLRTLAEENAHHNVLWCNASLPDLTTLPPHPSTYDLILLSAVWMHLPESLRPPAIARLAQLLSANGRIVISLRFGPSDEARPMYSVSYEALCNIAASNGLMARNINPVPSDDGLQRDDVKWVTVELMRK